MWGGGGWMAPKADARWLTRSRDAHDRRVWALGRSLGVVERTTRDDGGKRVRRFFSAPFMCFLRRALAASWMAAVTGGVCRRRRSLDATTTDGSGDETDERRAQQAE